MQNDFKLEVMIQYDICKIMYHQPTFLKLKMS